MAKDGKFGTFGGVFTPSVLTSLGVVLALLLIVRFGATVVDLVPMSRARRSFVTRFGPAIGAVLVAGALFVIGRWLLRGEERFSPYVLGLVAVVLAAASWGAIRDVFAIDGDRAPEIERAVREALAAHGQAPIGR